MPERNFLLGFGERLTEEISHRGSSSSAESAYSFDFSRARLAPMMESMVASLDALPEAACPSDEAVAVITLHPQFLSKSAHPGSLLREAGLETVGSRPTRVQPEKWARKIEPEESPATDLFIAGPRFAFRNWTNATERWASDSAAANDLRKVEMIRAFGSGEKVRALPGDLEVVLLEVALHSGLGGENRYVLDAFEEFAEGLGCDAQLARRLQAGRLSFVPVRAPRNVVEPLAEFAYLRVARAMPKLRPVGSVLRSWSGPQRFECELPNEEAVDPGLHVAVFDGGMPDIPGLDQWVTRNDTKDVGAPRDDYLEHGANVTSALLFGPLRDGMVAERPFASIDHFRVLDEDSDNDEDLYDVLARICDVLETRRYSFVNLSIGPYVPIDDLDVHGWTAVLDDLLSDGTTLASVAVGNGGEDDPAVGNDRVQVPADCVNAMAVGAADSSGPAWGRASYSSIGPGRSPGMVKPDILSFGGSEAEPFWVIDPNNPSHTMPRAGTSFAAPAALRIGVGVRAHFGDLLSPLAIQALVVHCAEGDGPGKLEAGWGRTPSDLEDYVVCPEGVARVVYQGVLSPKEYRRARIPLPVETIPGFVTTSATFCYATATDPDHPGNYTRGGLDVWFRPHDEKFDKKNPDATEPLTKSFFRLHDYETEGELRYNAHKWETTLHASKRMRGVSLKNPVFDIHYNARESSADARSAEKIRYALVITVSAPRKRDLYDAVLRRYRAQLQPLQPVVEIPVLAYEKT